MSTLGIGLLVLSAVCAVLMGAALVSPWYAYSYHDTSGAVEQSQTTTNYLTYRVVDSRGNVFEISYVDDSQFEHAASLWRLVDALTVLTLVLFLLQAALAFLAAIRRIGGMLPTLMTIIVVMMAMLIPLYVLLALPLALSDDTSGNMGNLDSPPSPTTSFAGARSEPAKSVTWGPSSGWFFSLIAGMLSVSCPFIAKKIAKPLPRAVVRGRGFTPLQQSTTIYSNTPSDPMEVLRPGIGPAPVRSGPVAPSASGRGLTVELPPLATMTLPPPPPPAAPRPPIGVGSPSPPAPRPGGTQLPPLTPVGPPAPVQAPLPSQPSPTGPPRPPLPSMQNQPAPPNAGVPPPRQGTAPTSPPPTWSTPPAAPAVARPPIAAVPSQGPPPPLPPAKPPVK